MTTNIPDLDVDEFIEHYGVPGMKWGKRKGKTEAPRAPGYSDRMAKTDARQYGKKMVPKVNQAVANGKSLKEAREEERKSAVRKSRRDAVLLGVGAIGIMYGPQIADVSIRAVNSGILAKRASNGRKYAEKMMQDSRVGIANYDTIAMNYNPSTNIWD